jgi:hypothetical protein
LDSDLEETDEATTSTCWAYLGNVSASVRTKCTEKPTDKQQILWRYVRSCPNSKASQDSTHVESWYGFSWCHLENNTNVEDDTSNNQTDSSTILLIEPVEDDDAEERACLKGGLRTVQVSEVSCLNDLDVGLSF